MYIHTRMMNTDKIIQPATYSVHMYIYLGGGTRGVTINRVI